MRGTITILNRLKKKDSITGLDVWYKTVLKGIKYKQDKVTTVVGTDVSMGEGYTILIPFSDKYVPYHKWKDSTSKDTTYTMSQGDYIYLGIELEEDVTPSNVVKLKSQYEPNVCEVRSIEEVPISSTQYGVLIQLRIGGV